MPFVFCDNAVTGNHHQHPSLLNQASSDSELSRYRIRLSGSQANVAHDVTQKKSSERDTHSAVSSSKQQQQQQQGLFLPMQNMRHNMSQKVAQVRRHRKIATFVYVIVMQPLNASEVVGFVRPRAGIFEAWFFRLRLNFEHLIFCNHVNVA